jgi:hypothetical protein
LSTKALKSCPAEEQAPEASSSFESKFDNKMGEKGTQVASFSAKKRHKPGGQKEGLPRRTDKE